MSGTHLPNNRQRPPIASDLTAEDDEDLGTLIPSDDLDIMNLDSPHTLPPSKSIVPHSRARNHPSDLTRAIPSSTPFTSKSRKTKDGPATRKLEKDLDTQDDSDPIMLFSDESEPASRQPFSELPRSGIVKENVSKFEGPGIAQNTVVDAGPRIDLRTQCRSTLKGKMKHKVTQFKLMCSGCIPRM
jgi:hypothetical protein